MYLTWNARFTAHMPALTVNAHVLAFLSAWRARYAAADVTTKIKRVKIKDELRTNFITCARIQMSDRISLYTSDELFR